MRLTERTFWLEYWENKGNLAVEIKEDYILSKFLKRFKKENDIKSGIELGGFPGYYAVYLNKWLGIKSALFDYVIHPQIIKEVITKNGLKSENIELIEADLFGYEPTEKFDLVMSVGLIEHFDDTKQIIGEHLKFLQENGILFINLPNFKGLNGWVQKNFDHENYLKHNISCMDVDFLRSIVQDLGLKEIEVFYYGGFMMWLENIQTKSTLFRIAFKMAWFLIKIVSKLIPIETKILSPYINIIARK